MVLDLKLLYSLCVAISENIILKSNLVVAFYYEAVLEQGFRHSSTKVCKTGLGFSFVCSFVCFVHCK